MSLPRAAMVLALAAIASLTLSLVINDGFAQEGDPGEQDSSLVVDWAYRAPSVAGLVARSDAVVWARVSQIRVGEDIVLEEATRDAPAATLPTQLIDVEVERAIAGEPPRDLTLYKLGGEGNHPEGAPAYAAGERYLLFVRRRLDASGRQPNEDGTYLLTAPDGRLERLASERLEAKIDGPVAERFDGRPASEAEAVVADAEPSR